MPLTDFLFIILPPSPFHLANESGIIYRDYVDQVISYLGLEYYCPLAIEVEVAVEEGEGSASL